MDLIETEIEQCVKKMKTKEDFCEFLDLLIRDYDLNLDYWQNQDLLSFLTGLRHYATGDGGYFLEAEDCARHGNPDWSTFADMLAAARAFE